MFDLIHTLLRWFFPDRTGLDRVFSQQDRTIDRVQHAAVAIKEINPKQRHIGILHRDENTAEVNFLHLAWHQDLRNEPLGPSYYWIDPAVPHRRLRQVAARCRELWRMNPSGIPYAFSPPSDCFDSQTSEFLLGPTRHGLTCASFVLAVFELAGLKLVEYETWPTGRPGDSEWQQEIVSALESNGAASDEHIEAVKAEFGSVRCRPEEVAGAATVSSLPTIFQLAVRRALFILKRISKRR